MHIKHIEYEEPGEDGELGSRAFPINALPPILRMIALESARAQGVPVALTASAALATASAAIGGGLVLRSGPHRVTNANLFILAAAKSGTGKGRAFSTVCRPFQDIETHFREAWRLDRKPRLDAEMKVALKQVQRLEKRVEKAGPFDIDSLVGEMETLNRQIEEIQNQLKEPLWLVADVTREALADALTRGSLEALGSFSPEARGVVGVLAGRYGNGSTDEDIYLSGYSVESFSMNRIGRATTHLKTPCLTLFWMIQPDVLNSMLSKDAFTESGLLPRCLFFDSKAEPEYVPDVPYQMHPAAMNDWQRLLGELVTSFHQAPEPLETSMSEFAMQASRCVENVWIEDRRSGGHLEDISSYAARWAENMLRIALVLHTSEYGRDAVNQLLSMDTIESATQLMWWFIGQQLSILNGGRDKAKADKITRLVGLLRAAEDNQISFRDLEKNHNILRPEVQTLVEDHSDKLEILTVKPVRGPDKLIVKLVA